MDDQDPPQFDYPLPNGPANQAVPDPVFNNQPAPPLPPPTDDGGYSFTPPPQQPLTSQQQMPPDPPAPVEDTGAYSFAAMPDPPVPGQEPEPPMPQDSLFPEQQQAEVPQPQYNFTDDPGVPPPPPQQPVGQAPEAGSAPTDNSGQSGPVFTGLSGNEMYCLSLVGYKPGNIVVGNSVYSLGYIGGLASGIRMTIGGEIQQYTNMISSGRKLSLQRLESELAQVGGHAATGVSSELVFHPGNIEFLSVGSSAYREDGQTDNAVTTASDGQEFFCQIDAGYTPVKFVLGNVAYSIGIGRSFIGELREMAKGEVKQYSNVFNVTRNLALQRIVEEAKACGANSVVGIRTTILPLGNNGIQEMVMIGTASSNPQASEIADQVGGVITSDLTAEEMWNVTKLGYVPMKLILGTSVYSIGVVGGVRAAIRGYFKGEISALTQMIYGAREQSLKKVQEQATEIGADDVLGIQTYIYALGGDVIEFMAIGTAVKRVNGITPHGDQLPPQAIIRDKTTFVNTADMSYNTTLNQQSVDHQDQKNIV